MNQTTLICLIVFLALYIAWAAFLFIAAVKNQPKRKKPAKFDERQVAAQGSAYQWAFWSMCGYYFLYTTICGAAGLVWCDQYLGMLLGIMFGVTVFAVICIFRDAYFRPDQSKRGALICVDVICFSQGLIGLMHLREGTVIENGVLTGDSLQLFLLLMGLVINAAFLIKRRADQREEQE